MAFLTTYIHFLWFSTITKMTYLYSTFLLLLKKYVIIIDIFQYD